MASPAFFLFPDAASRAGKTGSARHGKPRKFKGKTEEVRDIEFSLFGEAIATGRITDWDEVCELEPYHIWTRDCIRERFDWGEEPGISFAVIRATKLKNPIVLPNRRGFGGCRSWVDLPAEEIGEIDGEMEPVACRLFDQAKDRLAG